jgi:hypothetical protein
VIELNPIKRAKIDSEIAPKVRNRLADELKKLRFERIKHARVSAVPEISKNKVGQFWAFFETNGV